MKLKLKKTGVLSVVILALILGVFIIKPWVEVDAVSTIVTTSQNNISTNISVVAHTLWVNEAKLEDEVTDKYITNTFESIMLSTDMYGDKIQDVTFTVYANTLFYELGVSSCTFTYQ